MPVAATRYPSQLSAFAYREIEPVRAAVTQWWAKQASSSGWAQLATAWPGAFGAYPRRGLAASGRNRYRQQPLRRPKRLPGARRGAAG
jgi:hypothetical protein